MLIPAQAAGTVILAAISYRYIETPIRTGALRRMRLRRPRLLAQPRTPFAFAAAAVAVLLALVALTPQGTAALPPGFTRQALASSQAASTHLVLPAGLSSAASSTPCSPHRQADGAAAQAPRGGAADPRSGPILAVGDSVMSAPRPRSEAALGPELHIDAVVSRQPEQTIARLFAYRAEGSLPRRVIVHIGDNGPVYYADLQRLKRPSPAFRLW